MLNNFTQIQKLIWIGFAIGQIFISSCKSNTSSNEQNSSTSGSKKNGSNTGTGDNSTNPDIDAAIAKLNIGNSFSYSCSYILSGVMTDCSEVFLGDLPNEYQKCNDSTISVSVVPTPSKSRCPKGNPQPQSGCLFFKSKIQWAYSGSKATAASCVGDRVYP